MPGAGCPGGRGPEAGEAGPLPRPAQPRPAEAAVARAEVTRPGEVTTCSAASAGPPQQKYKYFFDGQAAYFFSLILIGLYFMIFL